MRATIAGKPSASLGAAILKRHGFVRERTCVVGDRLDSDILLGTVCVCVCVCVCAYVCGWVGAQE
jgi:ribonucleotide monophosphatase NagD (HAD superfamily)